MSYHRLKKSIDVLIYSMNQDHVQWGVCQKISHHHYNLDFVNFFEKNPGKMDYIIRLLKGNFKFIRRIFKLEYHNPNRIAQK